MGMRDPGVGSYAHYFANDFQSEFVVSEIAFDHTYRF